MRNGTATELVCLEAAAAKPFDLPKALSDLAISWAGRHGSLIATLYLAQIDLKHGDVARALERIGEAIEKDEARA